MPIRRLWVLALAGALITAACSSSSEDTDEADGVRDAVLGTTTTTTTTTEPQAVTDPALEGLEGLIAATDRAGLQLRDPTTGLVTAEFVTDGFVTQPTWSRDGTELVAMAFDAAANPSLLLVDTEDGSSRDAPVSRVYFFFSWSPDGSRIAALGPGNPRPDAPPLTRLDILDRDGALISTGDLEGGSVYVAWEPGGDSLLVHQDVALVLFEDPTDLTSGELIAGPGQLFQAPAWIPGTRQALIVSESAAEPEISLLDVDSGDEVELGPAAGFVNIDVTADGSMAALGHVMGASDGGTASIAFGQPAAQDDGPDPASEVTALVEVVDLGTGERTAVSDVPALWLEWNPAGDALIVLHLDLTWSVWTEGESRTLTDSRPTEIFLNNYIYFSSQYNETPRLWSPDGSAITYSGRTDEGNRLYVLPVDGSTSTAIDLGPGHVSFWSPG